MNNVGKQIYTNISPHWAPKIDKIRAQGFGLLGPSDERTIGDLCAWVDPQYPEELAGSGTRARMFTFKGVDNVTPRTYGPWKPGYLKTSAGKVLLVFRASHDETFDYSEAMKKLTNANAAHASVAASEMEPHMTKTPQDLTSSATPGEEQVAGFFGQMAGMVGTQIGLDVFIGFVTRHLAVMFARSGNTVMAKALLTDAARTAGKTITPLALYGMASYFADSENAAVAKNAKSMLPNLKSAVAAGMAGLGSIALEKFVWNETDSIKEIEALIEKQETAVAETKTSKTRKKTARRLKTAQAQGEPAPAKQI